MTIKSKKQKKARLKPELPAGFRDYGPKEAIWKNNALEKIRTTFERFGFDPIETPAVERTEILTGGEAESEKIIFNIKGSRDQRESDSNISLRFDLTVPLARFVAANPEIPKPFKRYQIGEVYRGESPQKGRYRGFTQADADIVGTAAREAEVEVFLLLQNVFLALGVKDYAIKINNRKILNNLPQFADFPKEKLWSALRVIDKKDKIGIVGVAAELGKEFNKKTAGKIIEFLNREVREISKLDGEGGKEMLELTQTLSNLSVKNWEIDFSLARGLSYYTGVVFEAILCDAPEVGSIAAGGRYDNLLAAFTGQPIPAVGASIGIDRLFAGLEKLGKLETKITNTQVLILSLEQSFTSEYFSIAESLRKAGINTALYLGDDRAFQAQFAYAVKKEIPYVIIYGGNEQKKGVVAIKNLATREQKEIPKEKIVEYFKK